MIFGTSLVRLSALLLAGSTAVAALPQDPEQEVSHQKRVQPVELDVFAPPVTNPNSTTVWSVGDTQSVVWDTSGLSDEGKNATGLLLLGFLDANDTTGNEHLDIKHPLAHGFQLGIGSIDITVPNVTTRNSYLVALIGDSGDVSKPFTITN